MARRAKDQTVEPLSVASPVAAPVLLLYTRDQAARSLSVSVTYLDELRKEHPLLRPVKLGRRILWPYKNLLAFIDELSDVGGDDAWSRVGV